MSASESADQLAGGQQIVCQGYLPLVLLLGARKSPYTLVSGIKGGT
jgi:hypothetical protein